MCGVAGVVRAPGNAVPPETILNMTRAIEHRGPDFLDTYCHENVAFGHARLSILDLSELGSQPMHSEDQRYTIIYNGEVYNFKELREELVEKGYKFKSSSDTEVILNAYIEWGEACVPRLNGMFAFSILDKVANKLFFARDRYGIKPLYFGRFQKTFLFGSEIKAIECHPDYSFDVNKQGLKEYFAFQNFLSDQTLNAGVFMFPAGHTGTLNINDLDELKLKQYWDFSFEEIDAAGTEQDYAEELDRLFQQAVKRQLVSDVPLGTYLSGGMDSGSITAISAPQIKGMHTFTCGFDMSSASQYEKGFDESEKAKNFAKYFGTKHHEKIITSSDMEQSIPIIARHLEEPRVGQSYPNYYAAELARSKVTVVLSGAGGDELFAGYPWRYYRAISNQNTSDYLDKYYSYWQRLVPEKEQQTFFSPIWDDISDYSIKEIFSNIYSSDLQGASSPADFINQSLYFEAKTFLHGLLVVEDKLSMAHSLESRVPFLDNDLVDFAMKIPAKFKLASLDKVLKLAANREPIESYFHKSKDGKMILRNAMSRHLPENAAKREKQGFSGPDASWFKLESADFIRDKLYDREAKLYQFLDYSAVIEKLNNHFNADSNARLLIWSLLNTEIWLENHL